MHRGFVIVFTCQYDPLRLCGKKKKVYGKEIITNLSSYWPGKQAPQVYWNIPIRCRTSSPP